MLGRSACRVEPRNVNGNFIYIYICREHRNVRHEGDFTCRFHRAPSKLSPLMYAPVRLGAAMSVTSIFEKEQPVHTRSGTGQAIRVLTLSICGASICRVGNVFSRKRLISSSTHQRALIEIRGLMNTVIVSDSSLLFPKN